MRIDQYEAWMRDERPIHATHTFMISVPRVFPIVEHGNFYSSHMHEHSRFNNIPRGKEKVVAVGIKVYGQSLAVS